MANNNNYSRIMITGNLTKDPVITERTVAATGEIMKVANITIAKNFTHRDGRADVTFYDFALWGDEAEKAVALKKGYLAKVYATDIENRQWTGRDGVVRTSVSLKGLTGLSFWDRQNKAWAEVVNKMKAEAKPGIQATAEAGVTAESLPVAG